MTDTMTIDVLRIDASRVFANLDSCWVHAAAVRHIADVLLRIHPGVDRKLAVVATEQAVAALHLRAVLWRLSLFGRDARWHSQHPCPAADVASVYQGAAQHAFAGSRAAPPVQTPRDPLRARQQREATPIISRP
jgi:hypothetical protein